MRSSFGRLPIATPRGRAVWASEIQGGDQLPARLGDVLATLPKKERKRFRAAWCYLRSTLDVANLALNDPRPGLDQATQFEDLLAFAIRPCGRGLA